MTTVAELFLTAAVIVGAYAAIVPAHTTSIRFNVQTAVLLLAAMCALAGCTTKVVIPDQRQLADGSVADLPYPDAPLGEKECAAAATDPRYTGCKPTAETFDADKLAWMQAHTHEVPMWGCTGFDGATTIIGLAAGFAEANPIGLVVVPFSLIYNHIAEKRAQQGDLTAAKTSAAVHCGAGALNVLTIAGAL